MYVVKSREQIEIAGTEMHNLPNEPMILARDSTIYANFPSKIVYNIVTNALNHPVSPFDHIEHPGVGLLKSSSYTAKFALKIPITLPEKSPHMYITLR